VAAGLIEFATWVRFRHPLVRSAAYHSASLGDWQEAHRALAEATGAALWAGESEQPGILREIAAAARAAPAGPVPARAADVLLDGWLSGRSRATRRPRQPWLVP
jgi:hypothetical protein